MWKVVTVVALLIVAVLAGWFFIGQEAPYEDAGAGAGPAAELVVPPLPMDSDTGLATESAAEASDVAPLAQDPDWVLPALNQSDPFVREQLTVLGVPDRLTRQEELIRRLATIVENSARAEYPRRQLAFLAPQGGFRVIERDGRQFIDPANYARYDALVGTLEAVDPRQFGRLLTFLMPLVDDALAELGSSGDAKSLMAAGLVRVLEVPVLDDEVEVLRPNVFFEYADPALEQRGALQKLLLRTGPANVQRVQAWVRRFADVMGIPVGAVGPT